jgi:enterochelin esterase-like enzyme
MKNSGYYSLIVFVLAAAQGVAQQDLTYFSKTYNAQKPYRIFLPADYQQSKKRYPVIYFLHGNSGTHALKVEGVSELVNENSVIVVALNGRSDPADWRPYNIGGHPSVQYAAQFKDYFLEAVSYIDSAYRTLNDRANRALIGHSMGGFMSFVLAGEHPGLIGTAVDIKGSPEFFVGHPDNHTLYSLRFMFQNLLGVRLKLHNSTVDELVHLNSEVNQGAIREKDLDYAYAVYPGGHAYTAREFSDAVDFVVASIKDPLSKPERWHHCDFYPDFNVWGYSIKSNLHEPGFIDLKGVTKGGMRIRTRKWEPQGPLIPGVEIQVTTAPVYLPGADYTLFDFNATQNTRKTSVVKGDRQGRITFSQNHEDHQIGIFRKNDPPEIVLAAHQVNGHGIFFEQRYEQKLNLQLLNRGASAARRIKVTLHTTTDGVTIETATQEIGDIAPGEIRSIPSPFSITAANRPPADGSPSAIRFDVSITDDKGHSWKDEFDAPVYYDVPAFTKIGIDDGDRGSLGTGNGNHIAEPGETFSVYQGSHLTRLYCDDPNVEGEQLEDTVLPDKWGGDGFTLSSLIRISKDAPVGHQIKFLASFEEKEWKVIKRNVTWGIFILTVGKEPVYE